ncbi:bifunctional protein-disulfide isomerase/oxidoreductase DsbC [Pseudomonas sp. G11-1]|uniref:Thiol:disulfide interchange protein n=1 Tax=Halopseudomonas bauzanensis TaxID=653930 RepID=A0A4U0YPE0_9GAMM|nr:bifunctional protein-disulfide isomerase/oxidoreductase DsbC [Halopseudomonas bauzanensis]EZQ18831.1 protein-disulfide isomerase [Halopseudomonas bauzanensis]MCO5787178.1 bifunctional protein-disulfide isomerase/oxidoreductase DsbC [Pseudomonas sp. G11-1]MCO5790404.1 bifunctional protein-disulfide isomerase/oxidoreductase DsbC [Pseudomonas sp. G11-2]TKA92086.1 bifunctional protein-disulfide isomerase/oxidoreductase DsbC [Halopseudomonas bauzanensis]
MRLKHLTAGLLALCATQVWADAEQSIRQSLDKLSFPVAVSAISETPVNGLYQIQLDNGRVLYGSADGKYLVQGALIAVNDGQPRNLTAEVEAKAIGEVINGISREDLVIFAPKQPKTHITVFTDVDCGYCRKLHEEIGDLNELGIEVRYAAFPRAGLDSKTAEVMGSIWCADDRQAAMTRAKQGKSITPVTCENPIAEQYQLGAQVGVQGTPAIFMANGTLVPGYKPAQALAQEAIANQ